MKICKVCSEEKPKTEYGKYRHTRDGLHTMCKSCWSIHKAKDYKEKWFTYQSRLKKAESKRKGLDFNLTPDYLESIWTTHCPVFNFPFVRFDKSHPHSPALDRIVPSFGYIKGNVRYISSRANRIKYDATAKELKQVLDYLEGATTIPEGSTPKRVEAPDTEDTTQ